MSFEITTAFTQQYHANVERALQQNGSVLRQCVRVEPQKGEYAYYDQIGTVEAEEITTRHGNSPEMDTPSYRRRVGLKFYDVGDYIDDEDKARMLIDPTSSYVQNFVDALGRKIDDAIIEAALGAAYTGKSGGTSTPYDSNMTVAVNFATTETLTIAKLIEARRKLLANFNIPGKEPWFFVLGSKQLGDLLNTTEVKSSDYNTVKALVQGEVDTFLGFKFVMSERLGLESTDDRQCLAFPKSAILLAMGIDITTRVAERSDKRFNLYAYAKAGFGAVRMDEKKMVKVLCDE